MKRYGAAWRWRYMDARRRALASGKAPGVVLPVRERQTPILTAVEGRVVQFKAKEDA